jgi:hypothetical protein
MTNRNVIPNGILDIISYFIPRLMFLNSKIAPQIHWGDLVRVLSGFNNEECDLASEAFWNKFMLRFKTIGDEYKSFASNLTNEKLKLKALKSAAANYHWAEFMYFTDKAIKTSLRHEIKSYFWFSINKDKLKIISAEVIFEDINIPYYVLTPLKNNLMEPFPCVILSNGLDSITELEIMSFAELFIEQGIAVILFDGPGQGINVGKNPLKIQMEEVIASILQHLLNYQDIIDLKHMGFFGISFGGYFSLRVAKYLGNHFKLIVNYSGGPVLNNFDNMKRRLKEDFRYTLMINDDDKIRYLFNNIQLNIKHLNVDVISIHGEFDDIFPIKFVRELSYSIPERHFLITYPSESHVCLNYLNQISMCITDSFYKKLVLKIEKTSIDNFSFEREL